MRAAAADGGGAGRRADDRTRAVESHFEYPDERRDHAAIGEDALLHPEQAGDVTRTFGPVSGTTNSTCEPAEYETTATTLKWHLQCKGQLDLEIIGSFSFDSSSHYTAIVASKGWMAKQLISDVKTEVEGERVGDCPQ